jgi:site-specific recombinase XerD
MSIKVSFILYTSKKLSTGEYPIMIRLSKKERRAYVSTGLSSKKAHWNLKTQKPRSNHPNEQFIKTYRTKKLNDFEKKLLEFKTKGIEPTFDALIDAVEVQVGSTTVYKYFDKKIKEFKESNQIGNSKVYRETKNSFFTCFTSKRLEFSDIDYSLLTRYANFLNKRGVSSNTKSIRFRTIRALYNMAINEKYAHEENYPFKTFKVSQFKQESKPRAISDLDINKIKKLKLEEDSSLFHSRQYFLFSYYGAGINFTDMANLQWKNIKGNRVEYRRSKTNKIISFLILPKLQEIIDYWRRITFTDENDHILPILNKKRHKTSIQIHNRVHKIITIVNKDLKTISTKLDLTVPLTTYVARHTFASSLMVSNIPSRVIGEMLGHEDEKTTEIYLKKLDNKVLDNAMKKLA